MRIFEFIPESVIQALGWTFVHSLWQIALLAILLGFLFYIFRKYSANFRYILSIAMFVMIIPFTIITFISYYEAPQSAENNTQQMISGQDSQSLSAVKTFDATINFWERFINFYESNIPLMVSLWLLGIFVFLLKFMGSLLYVHRIKSYNTVYPGKKWDELVNQLASSMHIRKGIQLCESMRINIPITIGYLKPVVLLPLGAITAMPTSYIEAVLAHELAHIKRKDYLINMIQSLIEIVFFYHPGIWWISSIIRNEREHCCDDIAIAQCGDPLTYAKALAELQQLKLYKPVLAPAFSGRKNKLLNRIKRTLNQSKMKPNFMEGFIAAGILIISFIAITASGTIHDGGEGYPPEGEGLDLPKIEITQNASDLHAADTTKKAEGRRLKAEVEQEIEEPEEETPEPEEVIVEIEIPEEIEVPVEIESPEEFEIQQEIAILEEVEAIDRVVEPILAEMLIEQIPDSIKDLERKIIEEEKRMRQKEMEMQKIHQEFQMQEQIMQQRMQEAEFELQEKQMQLQKKQVELEVKMEQMQIEMQSQQIQAEMERLEQLMQNADSLGKMDEEQIKALKLELQRSQDQLKIQKEKLKKQTGYMTGQAYKDYYTQWGRNYSRAEAARNVERAAEAEARSRDAYSEVARSYARQARDRDRVYAQAAKNYEEAVGLAKQYSHGYNDAVKSYVKAVKAEPHVGVAGVYAPFIYGKNQDIVEALKEQLYEDDLIKKKTRSYKLTDSGFYINTVEQPKKVFRRYKKIADKAFENKSEEFETISFHASSGSGW